MTGNETTTAPRGAKNVMDHLLQELDTKASISPALWMVIGKAAGVQFDPKTVEAFWIYSRDPLTASLPNAAGSPRAPVIGQSKSYQTNQ